LAKRSNPWPASSLRFDAAPAGEHILRELASAMADDGGELQPPAKKKSPAEEAAEKRRKKLTPGSLMKGLIRSGSGDATPAEGDQVIIHCTTRTMDGIVVNSTRREHGGDAIPFCTFHLCIHCKYVAENHGDNLEFRNSYFLRMLLLPYFLHINYSLLPLRSEMRYSASISDNFSVAEGKRGLFLFS